MAYDKIRLTLTSWTRIHAGRRAVGAASCWDGAFLMDNAALWDLLAGCYGGYGHAPCLVALSAAGGLAPQMWPSHNSCSVCPQISPSPWECAPQLWPALQGVILGYDLFNYNPHHCTVTCSQGCDPSYQCNSDTGTFPHGQTSSIWVFFFPSPLFFPQAPNIPSFHSALGRQSVCYTSWGWENSQMPEKIEDNLCLLSCLGLYLMPQPLCQSWGGCWRPTSCKSHPWQQAGPPAQRCVVSGLCAGLQVMS